MLYTDDPDHPGPVAEWGNDWKTAGDLAEALVPDLCRRLVYHEQTTRDLYRLLNAEPNWSAPSPPSPITSSPTKHSRRKRSPTL